MAVVDIQPPNNIYETFARLNYKPWYAIAEFVDNSTQSFISNRGALAAAEGRASLLIDVGYDPTSKTLTVRDDAHGMDLSELQRAMRISTPPPDRSGRSEFGMGMKTAACWFGPRWTVTTTQLGVDRRYRIVFDVEELTDSGSHSIEVVELPAEAEEHGTTIFIEELRKPIAGRQIEKVKDLLTSMYRADLRDGIIDIRWRGTSLGFEELELWVQEREDGTEEPLRQPINTSVTDPATGEDHIVTGWVGVLSKMSSGKHNGFALMRRGRVIIGGPGEGWKPQDLVGASGSPEWKRLVGELQLDDFPVNFTKDGFAWDGGLEDALIESLKPELSAYKKFASNLRTRSKKGGGAPADFARAVEELQTGVNDPEFKRDVTEATTPLPEGMGMDEVFDPTPDTRVPVELVVPFPDRELKATLYVKDEGMRTPWLTISTVRNDDIDILLNTSHPFVHACLDEEGQRTVLAKLALAVGVAEQQARNLYGDTVSPEDVRILMNTVMLHALK